MVMKKLKLYKFTFYGAPSHYMDKEPSKEDILSEIEEHLSYAQNLNQITTVTATEQSTKK